MTREEKDLVLRDLSARLPYGVIGLYSWKGHEPYDRELFGSLFDELQVSWNGAENSEFVPYLRPMSDMTEEEKEELLNLIVDKEGAKYFHITNDGGIAGNHEVVQDIRNFNLYWINFNPLNTSSYLDWLNKKMFDYRGLIPKGLADYAEEGMYKL